MNVYNQLPEIFRNKTLKNFKLVYWLGRLETQIEMLAKAYDKTRAELVLERAMKDENDKPKMRGNKCIFSDDPEINLRVENEIVKSSLKY